MNIDEIEKLLKEGKVEDALKIVKKEAKGKDNDYAKTFFNTGASNKKFAETMENKEEFKLAINYFKLAEKLGNKKLIEFARKGQAAAHNNLGNLLDDLKRYEEAEKEYMEALIIDPNHVKAIINLGFTLSKLGRHRESEIEFKKASKLDPDLLEAKYRESIETNPNSMEAHNNLGSWLADLERPDEAEKEYKKAIKINPEHPTPHNNLGVLWQSLGNFDKAEKEYKIAFEFCIDPSFKKIIAENLCMLYFKFFEKEKIEEHKKELQKIKDFFKENTDAKEFLVDACSSYHKVIGYFSAKEHNKAKKKLEETKVYLKKCDEKELLELVERTNDLISLDKEFNDLMCLLSTYQKDKILERISNISKDAEKLSKKGFLIEGLIKHYISCVKTFDECFDLFRYEKPIDIDIEELSKSEDFFVDFGFSVDKNPANSVIRIANKINECSNKITENPEKKKEIIDNYWEIGIKKLLPGIVPELNGYAIGNMINNETQKQTTEVLKTLSEPIMRIDRHTERTETKVDELLKIAKSTEKTIEYIKGSIDKASSENKEILEMLIELTERYGKLHNETNESLNSINYTLAKLVSEEDVEGIKQIAEELTNKENEKKVIGILKEGDNKSRIMRLFEKLKNKVEKLPEDVANESYKKLVIKPVAEAIIDLLKQGVEKSPEVIPVLLQIMRTAPILTAVML